MNTSQTIGSSVKGDDTVFYHLVFISKRVLDKPLNEKLSYTMYGGSYL